MAQVHSTAIVEPGAELGEGTVVGPYSIIRRHVRVGDRCVIGPHVVLEGHTVMGNENQIFQFASVGSVPQDLKFKGEPSRLEVGDKNIIREYATLQIGTEGGGMVTKVGSRNLFMVSSHVGHDSQIGDDNVIANCVAIAGHVTIGNRVTLGGLSAVHQFVRVGDFSLLAGGGMLVQDLPHFCMAHGDRANVFGLNQVGLKRAGIDETQILQLRKVFRAFYYATGTLQERIEKALTRSEGSELCEKFAQFLRNPSSRGYAPRQRKGASHHG